MKQEFPKLRFSSVGGRSKDLKGLLVYGRTAFPERKKTHQAKGKYGNQQKKNKETPADFRPEAIPLLRQKGDARPCHSADSTPLENIRLGAIYRSKAFEKILDFLSPAERCSAVIPSFHPNSQGVNLKPL